MNKIIILIIVFIVLGLGWYFVSPIFIDKEVNEEFPSIDSRVAIIPTREELAEMPEELLDEIRDQVMEDSANQPDKTMEEEMPVVSAEPKLLKEGVFKDADSFHKGSGDAHIFELPDGSRIARLENFSVTNGPDLRVILVENSDPKSRDDVGEGYIELGKLKGNVGNQNYAIPNDIDLSLYKSVVIYCKPFHVVFSSATLK